MFTAQQEKLRENDEQLIVRSWTVAPFIGHGDAKVANPNYHPTVCQREDGTFCNVDGDDLPLSQVPDYIKEAGKPPKAAAPTEQRKVSLADAMKEATAANASADRRPTSAKPARRKAQAKK